MDELTRFKNKKGFYFSLDAVLAGTIITFGFILLFTFYVSEEQYSHIEYLAYDIADIYTNLKVSDINNPYINELVAAGNITDINSSLLDLIGEYYAKNATEYAFNLSKNVTEKLIPAEYGFGIYFDGSAIYERQKNVTTTLISSKKMISGIEKGRPVRGATSRAYLKGIREKKTHQITYFGGFVGQGNLTTFLDKIPSDKNITNIIIELDAEADFLLFINNKECNSSIGVPLFTPTTGNMTSDSWDITRCNTSIVQGKNNITINFTGSVNNAYIGGGYIKVVYKTSEFQEMFDQNIKRYYFPGIEGIINLYDSFYVPGNITNITINLHYIANHTNASNNTLYLTIGNQTIYEDDSSTSVMNITLNETNSQNISYSLLTNKTIPLRFGFWNLSYVSGFYSLADAVLITDSSGSMDWNFTTDNVAGIRRNCDDLQMMDKSSRRLTVAKCLDKDFANQVIDAEGARIGLISYDTTTRNAETVPLTRNITLINDTVGVEQPVTTGYTQHSSTCICCGLISARNMLTTEILMTNLTLISSNWNWTNNSFKGDPLADPSGNKWYDRIYSNETQWKTNSAVLGANYVSGIPIANNMSFNLSQKYYFDLWDMQTDNATTFVDFTSGLNSTANTFIGSMDNSSDDGWDWSQGAYGTDGTDMTSFYDPSGLSGGTTTAGSERIEIEIGGTTGNHADSGAFGVQFFIDNDTYDLIEYGNILNLSFAYEAIDRGKTEEAVWLKARFGNGSVMNYLGYDLDSQNSTAVAPNDSTKEILYDYNPGQTTTIYTKYARNYDEVNPAFVSAAGTEGNGYANDGNVVTLYTYRNYTGNDDFRLKNFELENGTINGVQISCYIRARNHNNDYWGIEATDNNGTSWTELEPFSNTNHNSYVTFNFPSTGYYTDRLRDNNPWTWSDISALKVGFKARDPNHNTDANSRVLIDSCWITINVTELAVNGWHVDNLMGDYNKDGDGRYNKGTFSTDVASYVTSPGWYYLDLGAKFNASLGTQTVSDGIIAYFDNISLSLIKEDTYYLRRHFNISNLSRINGGLLSVLADDRADVYINGNLVLSEKNPHNATYWNVHNQFVYGSNFRAGDNVIAVKLYNAKDDAKFNLRLFGTNNTRMKGMFLITDGEANVDCGLSGSLDAKEEAIDVACKAFDNFGIITHSVGFGDTADEDVLRAAANCSGGLYAKSSNTTELKNQFAAVVISFMQATLESQSVVYTGDLMKSTLYPDSFIDITYDSYVKPPDYNEISLNFETDKFKNCTSIVNLYGDLRIVDSKVSSFSGPHWTKEVLTNENVSFNLSQFSSTYKMLGDPFMVNVPTDHLTAGNNSIYIQTGDNSTDYTNCSMNNSMFYTAMLDSSITYTTVLPLADGCNWIVEYQDFTNYTLSVPVGYIGTKNCTFAYNNVSYGLNDTIDTAVYSLLNRLDFDNDNRTNINLDLNDLSIEAIWVPRVPYAWGPSIIELRVWQ